MFTRSISSAFVLAVTALTTAALVTPAAATPTQVPISNLGVSECANDINDLGVVVTDTKTYWFGRTRSLPKGMDQGRHINNRGWIAGESGNEAVVWNGRKLIRLGFAAPGDTVSYVGGINERGDVVGTSTVFGPDAQLHAWIWRNGKLIVLQGVSDSSSASGVNDKGQVVGFSRVGDRQQPVKWDADGSVVPLNGLGGDSLAVDINNSGVVVGYSYLADNIGGQRAVYWNAKGVVADIDTPTANFGNAVDVNNRGQVTGSSIPLDLSGQSQQTGFVWRSPGPERFSPTPATGHSNRFTALNEYGVVVGCDLDESGNPSAILWHRRS